MQTLHKQKKSFSEITQLRRIAGQINGIENLLLKNAEACKILQQIEAARGNLKSLEKKIISQRLKTIKNPDVQGCFDYLCKIS